MKLIASSILLVLVILNIGISLAQHNQIVVKKHDFGVSLFSAVVQLVLFYYAGLFDCFKE